MESLGKMLDDESYRHGIRDHFMGRVKNSKLQVNEGQG